MHTKRKAAHQSRLPQPTSAHRDAWYEAPSYDRAMTLAGSSPSCPSIMRSVESQFHTDEAEALEPIPPGVCSGKVVDWHQYSSLSPEQQ